MGSRGTIGRRSYVNCAPTFKIIPSASLGTPSLGLEAYHNPLKRKRHGWETSDSSSSHSKDDDSEVRIDVTAEIRSQPFPETKNPTPSARSLPYGPARQAWPGAGFLDLMTQQCCAPRDTGLADLLESLGQSTKAGGLEDDRPLQADGEHMPPCFSHPATLERIVSRLEGITGGHATGDASGQQKLQLPQPAFLLGFQDDWLKVSSGILRLWNKVGLRPYGGPKAIMYYIICPADLKDQTLAFFKNMSAAYHACHLGTHRPGTANLHGMFTYERQPSPVTASRSGGVSNAPWLESLRTACNLVQKSLVQNPPQLRFVGGSMDGLPDMSLFIYVVPPTTEPSAVRSALTEAAALLSPLLPGSATSEAIPPSAEEQGPPSPVVPAPTADARGQKKASGGQGREQEATSGGQGREEEVMSGSEKLLSWQQRYKGAALHTHLAVKPSKDEPRDPQEDEKAIPVVPLQLQVVTPAMILDMSCAALQALPFTVYTKALAGGRPSSISHHRPLCILADDYTPDPQDVTPLVRKQGRPVGEQQNSESATIASVEGVHEEDMSLSPPAKAEVQEQSSPSVPLRGRRLHCCYSWLGPDMVGKAEGWLLMAWTDSVGELQAIRSLELGSLASNAAASQNVDVLASSLCSKVMEHTLQVREEAITSSQGQVAFSGIVICRLNEPSAAERDAWQDLLHCHGRGDEQQSGIQDAYVAVLSATAPIPSRLGDCGDHQSGAFLELHPAAMPVNDSSTGRGMPDGHEAERPSSCGTLERGTITWMPPAGPKDAPLFPGEADCVRQLSVSLLAHREGLSQSGMEAVVLPGGSAHGGFGSQQQDKFIQACGELHGLAVLSAAQHTLMTCLDGNLGPIGWAHTAGHLPLHCNVVRVMSQLWHVMEQCSS